MEQKNNQKLTPLAELLKSNRSYIFKPYTPKNEPLLYPEDIPVKGMKKKVIWILLKMNWKSEWIAEAFEVNEQTVKNWKYFFKNCK